VRDEATGHAMMRWYFGYVVVLAPSRYRELPDDAVVARRDCIRRQGSVSACDATRTRRIW
jgi:hypothetical protein